MPVTLYRKERAILDFIKQYIGVHGFAPTLSDIAAALNVSSLATVHEHVCSLAKKGFIRKYQGAIRGIEVIEKPVSGETQGIEIPILGFIAAGSPIEPYTNADATMRVAPTLVSGSRRSFILRVKGDSMVEEGILDGDYVVVEACETANNGDIVVAILEGGLATLKRFFREATRIRLEPANAKMSPIFATNVAIQGKVVGVIRKY
jgi:repressor LexA